MTQHSPLDRLVAGLLSHGFRETEMAPAGWRVFGRQGREPRQVRERDLLLIIGKLEGDLNDHLAIPHLVNGAPSDQHALLFKCGDIYLRTRERAEYRALAKREPQRALPLDADKMLDEL